MLIKFDEVVKICYLIMICIVIIISNCSSDLDEADVINISNTPGRSEHPAIAVDSRGYFYVVWDDNFVTQESLVVYMVTGSPTGVWSDPVKIFEPRAANFPDIEIDITNKIHLIWRNTNSAGWGEVLYTEKSSGGNWTEPDTISIYGMSAMPDLALDNNGNVHIVWVELAGPWPVFYTKKEHNGSWSTPVKLSIDSVDLWSGPRIAIDPQGHAHVVWASSTEEQGCMNWVTYTTNAQGDTWSYPTVIALDSLLEISSPTIVIDNDEVVHVVWGQDGDIFYTSKTTDTQWRMPARICSTSTISEWPYLAIDDDGTLHLVWVEKTSELYYSTKFKESDWTDPKTYGVNISAPIYPIRMALSVNSVGIVFSRYIESDPQGEHNYEILFIEIPKYEGD